jgi:hypothetical protein
MRKVFVGGFLLVGLFIAGLVMLMRGCLSKYDERFALAPVLHFEKGNQLVLFSLVQNEKATSYERNGGMVSKSVSTTYLVQQNDALTGAKTAMQEVKHHNDIKNFPVEVMGASEGLAWVFMGEPMGFDPFTLEKKADIAILEAKNPALKGRFPAERRFYRFNTANKQLYITANDGTKWQLNTTTLLANPSNDDPEKGPQDILITAIEKLQQQNQVAQDTLNAQHNPRRFYVQGKFNTQEYNKHQKVYYDTRTGLYQQRDSLYAAMALLREQKSAQAQLKSAIESLQRLKPSYSQIKTNQDTVSGNWFGLYAGPEWEKLYERVQLQSAYDETARRQFYVGSYGPSRNGIIVVNKDKAVIKAPVQYFLHGGFLLNKTTALPIRLASPAGYLVVHKDKIGNEGKTLISRINEAGTVSWTFDTGLTDWVDWLYTGKQLFILGADNRELSSGQSNVLWCVDLATGKASRYDYFTDKK